MGVDKKQIERLLRDAAAGDLLLLKTTPHDASEANFFALRGGADRGMPLIYALTKYPFSQLKTYLDTLGVYRPQNTFIDLITSEVGDPPDAESDEVMYLDGPQDLQNLNTSISLSAKKMGETTLLVIDSLSSMLTYNTEKDVVRFFEVLKDRIRTHDLAAIVFYDAAGDEHPPSSILQYVDTYTTLDSEERERATVEEDGSGILIRLPTDVATSLDWRAGVELVASVVGENTLRLQEE